TSWGRGKTIQIKCGVMARRLNVFVEGEGLRQRPESLPIPFSRRAAAPKIVRGDGFDPNFNGAADDVLVRVRVLADKKSGHAVLPATWAAVKIVQAGHRVRGSRANLRNRQDAPLRVAEHYKITGCCCDFPGNSQWLGEYRVTNRRHRLNFVNLLGVCNR